MQIKSTDDSLEAAQAATQAAKAKSKGQVVPVAVDTNISRDSVEKIIFACDAGMGVLQWEQVFFVIRLKKRSGNSGV